MAAVDFDDLWNYDNPAATEQTFRKLASSAGTIYGIDWLLELRTQIARTLGLQQKFHEAHALLDSIADQCEAAGGRVQVRYLLERGRTYNSDKQPDSARPLFQQAYDLANASQLDFFTIDAAHMLAIVSQPEPAKTWNQLALSIAEKSTDAKARGWRGSLRNNLGWTFFDEKKYDSALLNFEKALAARQEQGKPKEIRIARWCLARTMRATAQYDGALKTQMELLAEAEAENAPDGFVYEEIAENLTALKRDKEAVPYFAKAYEYLSTDKWLTRDEPTRLARLKKLGKVK